MTLSPGTKTNSASESITDIRSLFCHLQDIDADIGYACAFPVFIEVVGEAYGSRRMNLQISHARYFAEVFPHKNF